MRAVVIAAGQGRRLRPHTDDRPKCMVEVAGRPLIQHQLEAFRRAGIEDVVIVRGYKGGAIRAPGCRFVDNHGYRHNNILLSLFCAAEHLVGDVIVSYGDIIYHPDILSALAGIHASGVLVVDRAWAQIYEGRTDHPIEQAELCRVSRDGSVSEVGKHVGPDGAYGEFIGLARFSGPLLARMWALFLDARARGLEAPYGEAKTLRDAYLTDLLNDAIGDGELMTVLSTEGGWREIDTVQDLERARATVDW